MQSRDAWVSMYLFHKINLESEIYCVHDVFCFAYCKIPCNVWSDIWYLRKDTRISESFELKPLCESEYGFNTTKVSIPHYIYSSKLKKSRLEMISCNTLQVVAVMEPEGSVIRYVTYLAKFNPQVTRSYYMT